MLRSYDFQSSGDILNTIRMDPHGKEFTYIILGRSGPTGKSKLRDTLTELGYTAFEISESVARYVSYPEIYRPNCGDHMVVDYYNKIITIVLNKLI